MTRKPLFALALAATGLTLALGAGLPRAAQDRNVAMLAVAPAVSVTALPTLPDDPLGRGSLAQN